MPRPLRLNTKWEISSDLCVIKLSEFDDSLQLGEKNREILSIGCRNTPLTVA